jgi:hypothetical protein
MSAGDRKPRVLKLRVLAGPLAVCRLAPEAGVPSWALKDGALASVTRTAEELSLVCPAEAVPPGIITEGPWRAIVVQGPLDFAWVGILASLSGCLARAGVSLFALSTFDTDYLLVKERDLPAALAALESDGHRIG